MFLSPRHGSNNEQNATMFLSPKYGCQIEIQIVNRKTYFPNSEWNLIMNCKVHSQ
jgi:hypothetical protein